MRKIWQFNIFQKKKKINIIFDTEKRAELKEIFNFHFLWLSYNYLRRFIKI